MTFAAFARVLFATLLSFATGFAQTPTTPIPKPPSEDAGIEFWQTDLAAARRIAGATHRPMLVVFRCER